MLKDTAWKLFEKTGNPCYYLLYKELTNDGHHDKGNSTKGH
ncbi:MAG: YqzL family protein [Clostridia bacterium]|nr:YqzL family protein [Clostridia bacterium]MBQ8873310.1 YqzL family protein [Clostridia bacterium]MBQ9707423.1 YqzL family protein [Clostridia bacterium]MBR7177753.1 YqzL family protein [Clostridia bacterium]